jgi:hypothetical protein
LPAHTRRAAASAGGTVVLSYGWLLPPSFSVAHVYRVASLVRYGDIAAAKVAAQRLLGAVPGF